jgi:hypothetical protein
MSLYSAAIEYYNRELDENNQKFYIEKMNTLNGQIKEVLDRQQRSKVKVRPNQILVPKPTSTNPLGGSPLKWEATSKVTPQKMESKKKLTKLEQKRMQDVMNFNIYTKQNEQEKVNAIETENQLRKEEEVGEVLKSDMIS